ncbi:GntR family transcriptional regulator [Streptomyces nodosus]|uniref:GntR family transcriptional regulator n=1 Tax=Streptomyces nodosus TaxID=40318 RepID=UPI00345317E3
MTSGEQRTEPAVPTFTSDRDEPEQLTDASVVPQWQTYLRDLPACKRRRPLTPHDRALYRDAVVEALRAGAKVNHIAAFLHTSNQRVTGLFNPAIGSAKESAVDRVERIIRGRIMDDTYQVHHVIPTQAEFSEEFEVSLATVVKASAPLLKAGLLLGFPARGTVVADPRKPPTGGSLRVKTPAGQWETWPLPFTQTRKIRGTIIRRIKDGTYPGGSRIPGARRLAKEFDTSIGAAKNALLLLAKQGILCVAEYTRKGTFVHPEARKRLNSTLVSSLTSTGTYGNRAMESE